MTKLAIYEQGKGREAIKTNKYKKGDYITLKMLSTAVMITIGYVLLVALWVIHKLNYYVERLVTLDYVNTGIKFLLGYLVILLVYLFIAYIVYSMKYIKTQEMNQKYSDDLKELYLMYKKEERLKKDIKTGGTISNDNSTY